MSTLGPMAASRTPLLLAAAAGFTAVAIGAFGAHGLQDRVSPELLVTFEVGVRYHAYHALALLALAAFSDRLGRPGRVAAWCFVAGILIFGGSLYTLVLTGQRWLGAVTPVGGLCFLAGWAALGVAAWRGHCGHASDR